MPADEPASGDALVCDEMVIIDVQPARDGWCVEVIDQQGRQQVLWLERPSHVPRIGDRVRCCSTAGGYAALTLEAGLAPVLIAERLF